MKKQTAYFAHSKKKYNTTEEAEELAFINKHFGGKVICPNKDLGELGEIENYLKIVKSTDCVYTTEFQGMIGRGVYDECTFALENNIAILVVRRDINEKFFVQRVRDVIETNGFDFARFGLLITK